jgi:hypothetical protein
MIVFGNPLPYDIHISGSGNMGFILKCGCCVCTFTDKEEMLKAIGEYIDHPGEMEKKYNTSNKGNCEVATDAPEPNRNALAGRPSGSGPVASGRSLRRTEPGHEAMMEDCGCQEEASAPNRR